MRSRTDVRRRGLADSVGVRALCRPLFTNQHGGPGLDSLVSVKENLKATAHKDILYKSVL